MGVGSNVVASFGNVCFKLCSKVYIWIYGEYTCLLFFEELDVSNLFTEKLSSN